MNLIPINLPVRLSEASALVELIVDSRAGTSVSEETRTRCAERLGGLGLANLAVYPGSIESVAGHPGAIAVAVDGLVDPARPAHMLLIAAPTASAAPAGFEGGHELGRIRPQGGREMAIHAVPFAPTDRENVAAFVQSTGGVFAPRPQRALPGIATGNRHPEISLPAAFRGFRAILETRKLNVASTVQLSATREMTTDEAIAARDGENPVAIGHTRVSIRHLFHCGLWAAIRAGWREGYTAEADHVIVTGANENELARSLEQAKEAIRHAAGYTKFTTDASRLFKLEADLRHPRAWTATEIDDRFAQLFDAGEQAWILDEFARSFSTGTRDIRLNAEQIKRLAVKFGRSLQMNEELYDVIQREKRGEPFDFEPSIDEAETLTTPEEMFFYMQWLKSRGRPAQLVPPNLGFKKRQAYPVAMESSEENGIGLVSYASHKMWPELCPRVASEYNGLPLTELGARIRELAAVARMFDGTLSIHSGSGKQAEVLQEIGHATGGRLNYKISGELQLQLLDVLFEQPANSPWRQMYNRMAARAYDFAARRAFGDESELAQHYRDQGKGFYLGDAARGRVDGNLFLVFWIGNLAGTRDANDPNGDTRFFTEKLLDLPAPLLEDVRRRNAAYVEWLASNLF
ncbi:MAG: hypothetical protein KJZ84_07760 [Bryobacteraceae bacterium]|nr:hypothetical protein [Bryobacteraceae bacterium]